MIDLEAKQIFNFYLIILINDDPDQEHPKCRLFKGFTSEYNEDLSSDLTNL